MTPLPSDGYHHPKLIHPVPADAYFYCRFSAFRHYAAAYSEELLDRLALLTYTDLFVAWDPEPDIYWMLDCQDYHDVELLLDVTGNLDAPF